MTGTVDEFFKTMDLTLRREMRSGFFLAYPLFQKLSSQTGRFSFTIEYWDESRLLVVGNVRTWPQRDAIIYNYSYQYQRSGKTIFRYDDVRHFPRHPHISPPQAYRARRGSLPLLSACPRCGSEGN